MKIPDQKRKPFYLLRTSRCSIQKKQVEKFVSVILIFAMFNLTVGCHSYFKVNSSPRPTSEKIATLDAAGKTIIIHFGTKKWLLTDAVVKNDTLSGTTGEYKMPPTIHPVNPERPNRYLVKRNENQEYLLNEVHLYLDEYASPGNNKVLIPVKGIHKIEIYDKDTAATVGSWFLGAVTGTAAFIGLLSLIIVLTKKSCPFIYTWDGKSYHFEGEIYSGSIHKPLERNDYLRLPTYPGQKTYTLKITNEVRESQYTNLMELLVVDHPKNVTVLADKNGTITTMGEAIPPTLATSLEGSDVTSLLASRDTLFYQSNPALNDKPLKDYLILDFPVKENAKSAGLVIRAKNSVLLDYAMGKFHDLFGSKYNRYMKNQDNASGAEMRQWTLDQGIPLSLYVERDGNWEFVDYYNVMGPMAFKDDVLKVPLKGNESHPLRLKLEFGTFLWEIDYAALVYSPDREVTTHIIPVNTAVNEQQQDVSAFLLHDDGLYYTQPEINNRAVVTFNLPEPTGQSRTIILHTKGWYRVLQQPAGTPDTHYLKEFRKPGRFNQFIYENLDYVRKQVSKPEKEK
ncbi:MAG: hypothetical protein Q8904_15180 [Bacteroidota bacterium]|nr:hypothetical protein [Bacteroidota bacterium]